MDYKSIMDNSSVVFSDIYEEAIENKERTFDINNNLKEILKSKRQFGLEKYKEHSFQSSLENCMSSPTLLHAEEEIVDLLNYLLHEQYKNDIRGLSNEKLKNITIKVLSVYSDINRLHT